MAKYFSLFLSAFLFLSISVNVSHARKKEKLIHPTCQIYLPFSSTTDINPRLKAQAYVDEYLDSGESIEMEDHLSMPLAVARFYEGLRENGFHPTIVADDEERTTGDLVFEHDGFRQSEQNKGIFKRVDTCKLNFGLREAGIPIEGSSVFSAVESDFNFLSVKKKVHHWGKKDITRDPCTKIFKKFDKKLPLCKIQDLP